MFLMSSIYQNYYDFQMSKLYRDEQCFRYNYTEDRGCVFRFVAAAGIGWFKSQCTSPVLLQTRSQLPGINHFFLSSFMFRNISFMKETYHFCISNCFSVPVACVCHFCSRVCVCLIVITFAIYVYDMYMW